MVCFDSFLCIFCVSAMDFSPEVVELSVFSFILLSLVKIILLNYFSINNKGITFHISPFLWGQLLKNYCVPLIMSCFHSFPCF